MRVLLLGGTGAMGVHLSSILSSMDFFVDVTSRSYHADMGKIHYIQGDAKNLSFLENVLKHSYDAIIDFMQYSTEEFKERVNILLKNTVQYFFFSSARVYANSKYDLSETSGRLLDNCKDQQYLSTDEYALSKARQEDILLGCGKYNWTIIRPYITYSCDRLQLGVLGKENWLYRALNHHTIVFSKDIAEKTTTMTYGYDTARIISLLISNKAALGKIIQIAGRDSKKWSDVLNLYLDVIYQKTGFKPSVIYVDRTSDSSTLNRYQIDYDRMYNRKFNSDFADEICGVKYEYTPMLIGLRKCLTEFLDGPMKFREISWHYEAWADKVSHENTPLLNIPSLQNKTKYLLFRYFL